MQITKSIAKDIAKEECLRQGWPWKEPVYVKKGIVYYVVWGGGRKGGNICIRIRKKDGVITSSRITPK